MSIQNYVYLEANELPVDNPKAPMVYCKGCRFFENSSFWPYCYSKDNRWYNDIESNQGSFYSDAPVIHRFMHWGLASRCNGHNDCRFRKPVPWWMFWRG